MRYASVLLIFVILNACRYVSPPPSPETSYVGEVKPVTTDAPSVPFTQAILAPAQAAADRTASDGAAAESRAYEDGVPLAARVNNQPLFLDTFESQVAQYEQALASRGVDLSSPEGQALMFQVQEQVLASLLDQLIIEQKAIDIGIYVSDEQVEVKVQEAISQMADGVHFENWLEQNGLSYGEFFAMLQAQLIASQVFERVTASTPKVANQIQLNYVRVARIDTADGVVEKLSNNSSFAALGQDKTLLEKSSIGPTTEPIWFPKGTGLIPPEVETIAFALNPGEISGPIPTADGYYVIRLEAKQSNRPISNQMLHYVKKRIFENWMSEQRASMHIEKYVAL